MALLARKAATPQSLDMNVRALQTARARRAAAVATRDRFDALIVKTRITAPIDGVVTARHVQPGETVREATAIVTVADLTRVRIEAEVDEFDAARVALGARSSSSAEGFRGASWHGQGRGDPRHGRRPSAPPRGPRPSDRRAGTARQDRLGEPTPLKLGQRVEVEVAPSEGAGP